MGKFVVLAFLAVGCGSLHASWYWPFGPSERDGGREPRLSELMEPASVLIDEASDLAAEGKVDEAIEKYRQSLTELDRIERENPERTGRPEFATVRNKRAYVNAAIDSMLLSQVKANARAVAVSDTTELERRLAAERAGAAGAAGATNAVVRREGKAEPPRAKGEPPKAVRRSQPTRPTRPPTRREQAMADIANGDFAAAELIVGEMLAAKPNGALALNLKATLEARQGKLKEAERTLDQAINSNPRDYSAYYNMAILVLQANPDATQRARRYYETGRVYGGPKDDQLEALLK
ncbi:MAG: tetratricopeptide repeat protein [Kiritimatiellia bacterium]